MTVRLLDAPAEQPWIIRAWAPRPLQDEIEYEIPSVGDTCWIDVDHLGEPVCTLWIPGSLG